MAYQDDLITVLSPDVAEKIAAGEVIERPASVLKELVENSLDSGATRIEITIEDAGFALIKVSDNGLGMGPKDLLRSLLRHATSKIKTAEDLFRVSTLGFRGEALASIAAVSRLEITSSASQDGLGYKIRYEDGKCSPVSPVSHMRGTTVSCMELFYNVPARKKFVKSRNSERMALLNSMEQVMIPYPSVHFSVWAEGKKAIEAPSVNTPLERIAQIAGPDFAKKLVRIQGDSNGFSADLYISAPENASARPRYQYLYVNLRRVDNDQVTWGIREGFARFMTAQLRPAWFCFFETDPNRLDVNVHPTKQRIKFDDEKAVFSFLYGLIQKSMQIPAPDLSYKSGPASEFSATSGSNLVSEPFNVLSEKPRFSVTSRKGIHDSVQESLTFLSVAPAFAADAGQKELEFPADSKVKLPEEQWELISCYQIHRLFILAPIKNGILLIDQHAAHERVLYEQALQDLKTGKAASQRLLFPIIIELSPAEKTVIMAGRDHLLALGFDIQDFGGPSVAVSAIPAAGMRESALSDAIHEMIGQLASENNREILSSPQKRYAAAFACGAAIKAGQELKQEEMNSLLNDLFAAENPYVCPHGRPTLIRISIDELSRRFLR
jgi:DNA mismatch repair protein MutL